MAHFPFRMIIARFQCPRPTRGTSGGPMRWGRFPRADGVAQVHRAQTAGNAGRAGDGAGWHRRCESLRGQRRRPMTKIWLPVLVVLSFLCLSACELNELPADQTHGQVTSTELSLVDEGQVAGSVQVAVIAAATGKLAGAGEGAAARAAVGDAARCAPACTCCTCTPSPTPRPVCSWARGRPGCASRTRRTVQVRVLIRANAVGTVGVGISGPDIETLEGSAGGRGDRRQGAVRRARRVGPPVGRRSAGGSSAARRRRVAAPAPVGRRVRAAAARGVGQRRCGRVSAARAAAGPAVARAARAAAPGAGAPGQGFRAVVRAAGRCRSGVVAPRSWVERRRAAPPPGRVLPCPGTSQRPDHRRREGGRRRRRRPHRHQGAGQRRRGAAGTSGRGRASAPRSPAGRRRRSRARCCRPARGQTTSVLVQSKDGVVAQVKVTFDITSQLRLGVLKLGGTARTSVVTSEALARSHKQLHRRVRTLRRRLQGVGVQHRRSQRGERRLLPGLRHHAGRLLRTESLGPISADLWSN